MGPVTITEPVLDALVVGAGFGGVYQLKQLRDHGYQVKLVDSASDFGGVWYWNRDPGARVDSTVPHYEFSDPKVWRNWSWKQRFPGSQEIRDYFAFVADEWNLRKDAEFNTFISRAIFDEQNNLWQISSSDSKECTARYLSSTLASLRRDTFLTGKESTNSKALGSIPHTSLRKSQTSQAKRSPSSELARLVCSSRRS